MKTQELLTKRPPTNFDDMAADMLKCEQTQGQSVYQHGQSVRNHFFELTHALKHDDEESLSKWRIPKWLLEYKDYILDNLHEALLSSCGQEDGYCSLS